MTDKNPNEDEDINLMKKNIIIQIPQIKIFNINFIKKENFFFIK